MQIATWINAHHLSAPDPVTAEPDGVPRLFVFDDFVTDATLRQLRTALAESAHWVETYGLFKTSDAASRVSRDEWLAAEPNRQFYRYHELRVPHLVQPASPNWLFWLAFTRMLLPHPDLRAWLSRQTGRKLGPEVQSIAITLSRGQFQRPHTDASAGRRLCGAFYLSDGWQPGFGGEFDMTVGGETVYRIEPKANRLVLFDPHERALTADGRLKGSKHCMLPLTEAAGDWSRRSLSIWWPPAEAAE